ncbi:MAG: COX15/CtaA family protein [Alphaproteobacteria bacterium]
MTGATHLAFEDGTGTTVSARRIGLWLVVCCVMVFGAVVIGGITRLTESGLSITQWQPLMGALPPLSEAEWGRVFALYQTSPQYAEINAGMDLAGFKLIFWWEWVHRLWGRLIGVVFLLPFIWFVATGQVSRRLGGRLLGLFILGGLQGALGWYMVQSGLVNDPTVSQYRLTAHLALALVILAAMLITALRLLIPRADPVADKRRGSLRQLAAAAIAALAITILSGGFMAGTDAGLSYNSFPLMDGALLPVGYFLVEPWYANPFENITAIQFNHRWLAMATFAAVIALWWHSRWVVLLPRVRRLANAIAVLALGQVALGIATLLLAVPVTLAAAHQANAVVLLSAMLWFAFELRPRRPWAGT